jgi:maltose O-acetyltransferase
MSEKEKMLAGEPYRASDAVLTAERLRAREALHRFNAMRPAEDGEARALLAGLFGALGEGRW